MRNVLVVMFVASALLVSACSENPIGPTPPVVTPEPTPTPSPSPSPAPTPALSILTDAVLPAGVLGQTGYNFGLSAEGGSGGYSWSVSGLPPELGFQLVEGALRAEMVRRTGRYTFTVTVEDSAGQRSSKELTFVSTTHLTELKTSSGGSTGVTISEVLIKPDKGARINRFFEANGSIIPGIRYDFGANCPAENVGAWRDPENYCFLFRAVVRNYNQEALNFSAFPSRFPDTMVNGGGVIPSGESVFQTPNIARFFDAFHGGERYVILSTSNGGRLVIDQEWSTIIR